MSKREDKVTGVSSKIEDVEIDLYDYHYSHGMPNYSGQESDFLGRKELLKKLRSILLFSKSQSGAYLITGFRGMGKTSLINKLISEITFSASQSRSFINMFRTMLGTIFVVLLFSTHKNDSHMPFTLAGFTALIHTYLILRKYFDNRSTKNFLRNIYNNIKNNTLFRGKNIPLSFVWKELWFFIKDTLIVDSRHSANASNRFFIIAARSVYLAFLSILIIKSNPSIIKGHIIPAIELSIVIPILIYVTSLLWFYPISKKNWQNAFRRIRDYFSHSGKVFIKINLGYDNLKELDILKLIAQSIQKEYAKFYKISSRNIYLKLIKIISIIILVYLTLHSTTIIKITSEALIHLNYYTFFPSQQKFIKQFPELEKLILNKKNSATTVSPGKYILYKQTTKSSITEHHISEKTPEDKTDIIHKTIIFIEKASIIVDNLVTDLTKYLTSRLLPFETSRIHQYLSSPNYLAFLLFIFYYYISIVKIPGLFNISNRQNIKKEIEDLNKDIEYDTSDSKQNSFSLKSLINVGNSRKHERKKADVREIENRLIDIFDACTKRNFFSQVPEFIFIFDELDKIEGSEESENDNSNVEFSLTESYYGKKGFNNKHEKVFKILSNLKHFINSSQAKFIFIAGREMYDASLSDVSDRNFFISSIFDKSNIYTPSFLTEELKNNIDLTKMTERFVCQYLFPPGYDPRLFDLNNYKIFLDKVKHKNESSQIKKELLINKKVFTLKQFITYLTYRSNGAPKKLSIYFEEYIHMKHKFMTSSLKLLFKEKDQYAFGFISYLITPIYLSMGESTKKYNDKLIVSVAFIIDNIYKFHSNSFSWNNINSIPEMLDINQSPQLREVISKIINRLTYTHLIKITNGLHAFKFRKKIAEEIKCLSKRSEIESAAFNFTLKESQMLKKYFNAKLKEMYTDMQDSSDTEDTYRLSEISLHMALGDIYFYDDEFNEAAHHYLESLKKIRPLSRTSKSQIYGYQYIVNMLKLGLTYEKHRKNARAFKIYSEIIRTVIKYRDIDINRMGLYERRLPIEGLAKIYHNMLIQPPHLESIIKDHKNDNKKFVHIFIKKEQPYREPESLVTIPLFDDKKDVPVCLTSDFAELMSSEPFSAHKEKILYKSSSFENSRIAIQPLLAKLQLLEKIQNEGITQVDLERIEVEFNHITKVSDQKTKCLLKIEFWSKIGDILFFRNSYPDSPKIKRKEETTDKCSLKVEYTFCNYYNKSLTILAQNIFGISDTNENTLALYVFQELLKYKKYNKNEAVLKIAANIFAGIGNSCYSKTCTNDINLVFLNEVIELFYPAGEDEKQIINLVEKTISSKECCQNKFERVIIMYLISFQIFQFGGNYKESALQLQKILYIIKDMLIEPSTHFGIRATIWLNFEKIEKGIAKLILINLCRAHDSIHRLEAMSYEDIMDKEIPLQNITVSSELRETIMILDELKVRCCWKDFCEHLTYANYQKIAPITPYSIINSKFRHIMELRLKTIVNHKILLDLEQIIGMKIPDYCHLRKLKQVILPETLKEQLSDSNNNKSNIQPFYKTISQQLNILNHTIGKLNSHFSLLPWKKTSKIQETTKSLLNLFASAIDRFCSNLEQLINMLTLSDIFHENVKLDIEILLKDLNLIRKALNNTTKISQISSTAKIHKNVELKLLINRFFKINDTQKVNSLNGIINLIKQQITTPKEPRTNITDEMIKFLIEDSIYCFDQILDTHELFNISYLPTNTFIGNAYFYKAKWVEYFNALPESWQKQMKVKKADDHFLYEKAKRIYHEIKDLHRGGKIYKEKMIRDMYYLNEDYDDTFHHFHTASERFKLNSDNIDKKIETANKKTFQSSTYKVANHRSLIYEDEDN